MRRCLNDGHAARVVNIQDKRRHHAACSGQRPISNPAGLYRRPEPIRRSGADPSRASPASSLGNRQPRSRQKGVVWVASASLQDPAPQWRGCLPRSGQGRNDLALQAVREPADICRPAGLCPRRGCRQSIEGRPVERAILPRHPHGISATVLQQGCASIRRAIGLNVRQPVRGPSESIVAATSTSGRADPYYDSIGENNRVEFPNAAAAETAGVRSTRNCP